MIVPRCHVRQLLHDGTRVTAVRSSQGDIGLPDGGAVVLALGTIESTRLALNSFDGLPGTAAVGRGLMAHLRSNLTIRVPRTSLPVDAAVNELAAGALLLKGRHKASDGRTRFFHLQITAAGLGPQGNNSEAEMWRKIPDIDTYDRLATASDSHVVITLRGIGETDPDVATNLVRLDPEPDEYGDRRAYVDLGTTPVLGELWDAMGATAEDAALAFAGGGGYDVLTTTGWQALGVGTRAGTVLPPARRHDGLGTTHHEAGTLRMGTDPATSADAAARLHAVDNAYVVGPALFPRVGSPNPMLTGVAAGPAARRPPHRHKPLHHCRRLHRALRRGGSQPVADGRPRRLRPHRRGPGEPARRRAGHGLVRRGHSAGFRAAPAVRTQPHRRQLRGVRPVPEPEQQGLRQHRLGGGAIRLRGADRRLGA